MNKKGSEVKFLDGHTERIKFEVRDRVRYIYDDELSYLGIKKGDIFIVKDIVIWNEKNTISYRIEHNGKLVGMREFELELV